MAPGDVVGVQVPASSANLGPGFDALAAALDLPLIAWTTDREERRVLAEGEGAALGRAITSGGGGDQDLIDLAAALEGHADNAAAAMLGGLCVVVNGRARRLEPSEALRPIACIPTARQSTEVARGLLPAEIPLAAAAANAARTAAVLAGLSGAMAWQPEAMRDALHEPPRLTAMAASGALVEAVRGAGLGACLSGAGPSVLVIAPAEDGQAADRISEFAGPDWTVLPLRWDRAGAEVCPRTIFPVQE